MEITVLDGFLFVLSLIFLFFIPGYNIMRKKRMKCLDLIAHSFVISAAIIFCISLLLSTTIGMSWMGLFAGTILVTALSRDAISAFRSANPL